MNQSFKDLLTHYNLNIKTFEKFEVYSLERLMHNCSIKVKKPKVLKILGISDLDYECLKEHYKDELDGLNPIPPIIIPVKRDRGRPRKNITEKTSTEKTSTKEVTTTIKSDGINVDNLIQQFIGNCIVFESNEPDVVITKQELYHHFQLYVQNNIDDQFEITQKTTTSLFKKSASLKKYYKDKVHGNRYLGGWKGIKLKTIE